MKLYEKISKMGYRKQNVIFSFVMYLYDAIFSVPSCDRSINMDDSNDDNISVLYDDSLSKLL